MQQKNQSNFYLILNVSAQAPSKEIKKAYLKLAQTYHPDKNRGNKLAEKKFQQINEAWQVLKDTKKRKIFDEYLNRSKKKSLENSLSKSRSIHQTAQTIQKQEKPVDLEFSLTVSLEELCQSCSKKIHYFKPVNGKKIKSALAVQIPLGARPGTRLYFKNEGGAEGKKIFGDLYVKIQIQPHKIFQLIKDSEDLILERPIPFVSVVKSQKLEVPSPYGFLSLNLNPPIKHKQLLKIKGHGFPKNLKGDKGDLFVKIFIDYPLKDSVKIQKQMERMSFDQQKIYVEKFKDSSFIYPEVLKFQKRMQELKRK